MTKHHDDPDRPSNEQIKRAIHGYFHHVDSHDVDDFVGAFSIFVHDNPAENTKDHRAMHICQFATGDMNSVAYALAKSIEDISKQMPNFRKTFFSELMQRMSGDLLVGADLGDGEIMGGMAISVPVDATPEQISKIIADRIVEDINKQQGPSENDKVH